MRKQTRLYQIPPKRNSFNNKDTYRLEMKCWDIIYHGNRNPKRAGVPIIMSDKTEFKSRTT